MKTRYYSSLVIRDWSFLLLATLTFLSTTARAPAQPGWGHALRFNSSYVFVDTVPLNFYPLTVSARVNTTDQLSTAGIVSECNSSAGYNLYVREGRIRAWYKKDNANYVGTADGYGLDGGNVADGVWHHVAFTVGPDGGVLYVDGTLKAMTPWTGTPGVPPTVAPLVLGYDFGWSGGLYVGLIDEVRIWNIARSQSDIQADMNQPLTNPPPNLVAYYRLDEGSGTRVYDASTNRADAIMAGASWVWQAATLPYLVSLPLSDITATTAAFNGLVNPNALATTARFEWGVTAGYGNSTMATNLGGTNLVTVSSALNGLTIGTTYHYRVVGSNSLGVAYSSDRSFTVRSVSNLADGGPGSLRQIIADAAGGDIIIVTNAGTLTLTNGELALGKGLRIVGPGAANFAISGNGQSRVFNISNNINVNISGVTIRDGHASDGADGATAGASGLAGAHGGGIYNAGQLTLTECVLTNNRAGDGGDGGDGANGADGSGGGDGSSGSAGGAGGAGGSGGGIYNAYAGVLWLDQCALIDNSVGGGGFGGWGGWGGNAKGLPGAGGRGGDGGNGGSGGGLFNAGTATLTGGTLSSNRLDSLNRNVGGGYGRMGGYGGDNIPTYIWPFGDIYLHWGGNGGAGGNGGSSGSGGGVYGNGQTTLNNCTISGNGGGDQGWAGAGGGGGYSTGDSEYGHGAAGGNGGEGGSGGGLYNNGTMELFSCTVAYNTTSRAGIGNNGGYGSTTGPDGSDGAAGLGGGVRNGGSGQAPSVMNTILALNTRADSGYQDVYGVFNSLGHNLVLNTSGGTGFGQNGDLSGLDPLLGPLADNGGPTSTHLPYAYSLVINAGRNLNVTPTDQRGLPRVAGGTIDIGACEVQAPPSIISYAWLQQHGWPTDGSVDYADPDHDGVNNWQEWQADTSPTDGNDYLHITSFTRSGTYNTLWWTSKPTRHYQVERCAMLNGQSGWETIITNNVPGWNNVGFDNAGPHYFYRIRAVEP